MVRGRMAKAWWRSASSRRGRPVLTWRCLRGITPMRRSIGLITAVLVVAAMTPVAAAPEEVEIPSGEAMLKAVLFKPDGAGPFPAVVALHGCNGLMDGGGALSARYRDWGE